MQDLSRAIEQLGKSTVLCIGDLMLDTFVYGQVSRISPEAPVPVFQIRQKQEAMGGAGNVLRNLDSLGVACHFLSVIGDDTSGTVLQKLADASTHAHVELLTDPSRPTTTKTRFLAQNQQLLRADEELSHTLSADIENAVVAAVTASLPLVAGVILSDYGKGVLSASVLSRVLQAAKRAGHPVFVDPKGQDYSIYRGASVLTPNLKELAQATQMPVESDDQICAAARHLLETLDLEAVLVTRSERGMSLITRDQEPLHIPTHAQEIFDVSGAGDTVIATFASAFFAGVSLTDAARLANIAAGIAVGKVGTATVTCSEIGHAVRSGRAEECSKIMTLDDAVTQCVQWRRQGLTIGFTNGCFDLLHPGHIALLSQARAQCDRLIVGLNTDASIKRLKGEERPIHSEAARSTVLSSLSCVDQVVLFGTDTPLELIKALQPDVLIKGSDYTVETVVGSAEVTAWGGRVFLADLLPNHSTTATVKKMTLLKAS